MPNAVNGDSEGMLDEEDVDPDAYSESVSSETVDALTEITKAAVHRAIENSSADATTPDLVLVNGGSREVDQYSDMHRNS